MEAIERDSGERCDLPVVTVPHAELSRRHATVDPADLIVPHAADYRPDQELEWVRGFDLIARRPTYVPLNAVVCPYDPPQGGPPSSPAPTGSRRATRRDEALATPSARSTSGTPRPSAPPAAPRDAVGGLLAAIGAGRDAPAPRAAATPASGAPSATTACRPGRARILRRLRGAGLAVYLRNLTGETGIAAIDCTLAERSWTGPI